MKQRILTLFCLLNLAFLSCNERAVKSSEHKHEDLKSKKDPIEESTKPGSTLSDATITSCTVYFKTPDCDGCDNKDHDTKLRVAVYGAHGQEVASTYYTQDQEFKDDNSEHGVPCTVTNNRGSGGAFAQKISVIIEPNGNDDWVFEARVVFMLSNGQSTDTKMNGRASVSRGNAVAVLWKQ